MNTWPEVRSSSPAMACISVDLPEPEGPMMAVKAPAAKSTVDAVEGADGGVALAVDLDGVDGPGGGSRAGNVDAVARCGAGAKGGSRTRDIGFSLFGGSACRLAAGTAHAAGALAVDPVLVGLGGELGAGGSAPPGGRCSGRW